MLKKILGTLVAAVLFVSMLSSVGLAVERYEVLQVGDEDAWVMELQLKLNELGYLKVPATGYYGTNTQNAVIAYQRDHGLTADGKAGPITRASILGDAYKPITGPRDQVTPDMDVPGSNNQTSSGVITDITTTPGEPSAPAEATPPPAESLPPEQTQDPAATPTPETPADPVQTPGEGEAPPSQEPADPSVTPDPPAEEPTPSDEPDDDNPALAPGSESLQLGDKGDAISDLQRRLKQFEYYDYGQITGYYGPITEDAVKKFERTNNLAIDGIMSPDDQAILAADTVKYYTMFPGDQGDDIYAMQERLIKLGYLETEATGYYGTGTTLAIKEFQETNGILADGTAGKETRAALYADTAIACGEGGPDFDPTQGIPGGTNGAKLVSIAESQAGKKYVYGASGPNAYDCSGLVYYALKGAGVSIGRMSSAGYATVSSWQTISRQDLQIGDLVFFRSDSGSSISHVGIYAGGGNIVHSAPSIGGVGISTMSSGYYSRNFVTAKRVF